MYGFSPSTRNSNTTLDNCILWNNSDDGGTGESAQIDGGPYADLAVNHTCVMGWTGALGGTGNIGDDPLFVDPDGPDDIVGTLDDNVRLPDESPCVNAGDNTALPADIFDLDGDGDADEPIPFDLDREHRVAARTVDMGAYECAVDCNNNGIPDDLDITAGTSRDINDNGIPDECDPPTAIAAGCRYVSLTPVSGPDPVALLVTSPELPCLSKYVNANGRLVDQPVFRLPEEWGTIHVGDAQIAPGTAYTIQTDRGDLLSAAATATTARWGDVVGRFVNGSWMPPDGSVDIPDAMAIIDRFRSLPSAPPLEWADLYPQIPNGTVEILDASMVVDAFRALPYPYDPPCP